MRWPKWLPVQWPAILFCLTLSMLTIALLSQHVSLSAVLCNSDETIVSCARNWFNASANIFTAIIATVAATYAYNQWREARNQAQAALLPSLERRIQRSHDVVKIVSGINNAHMQLIQSMRTFFEALDGGALEGLLKRDAQHISALVGEIQVHREKLGILIEDGLLDRSVFQLSNEVMVASDVTMGPLGRDAAMFASISSSSSLDVRLSLLRKARGKAGGSLLEIADKACEVIVNAENRIRQHLDVLQEERLETMLSGVNE